MSSKIVMIVINGTYWGDKMDPWLHNDIHRICICVMVEGVVLFWRIIINAEGLKEHQFCNMCNQFRMVLLTNAKITRWNCVGTRTSVLPQCHPLQITSSLWREKCIIKMKRSCIHHLEQMIKLNLTNNWTDSN